MNTFIAFVVCCVVGSVVGYNVQREAPYNIGPNDPYTVRQNFIQEPSQRLFWDKNQGSNQVGGTGLWATLTNKFPFLGNMFGRMELPTQYGVPNQYNLANSVPNQYNLPTSVPNQYNLPTSVPNQYNLPTSVPNQYNLPTQYSAPGYQPQFYQTPQFYQQPSQRFGQQFIPSGRDVGLTDDAVIVTPPFVPIAPQPAPIPAPAPIPVPVAPIPAPEQNPGYQYNKPQLRLELPHKK